MTIEARRWPTVSATAPPPSARWAAPVKIALPVGRNFPASRDVVLVSRKFCVFVFATLRGILDADVLLLPSQ